MHVSEIGAPHLVDPEPAGAERPPALRRRLRPPLGRARARAGGKRPGHRRPRARPRGLPDAGSCLPPRLLPGAGRLLLHGRCRGRPHPARPLRRPGRAAARHRRRGLGADARRDRGAAARAAAAWPISAIADDPRRTSSSSARRCASGRSGPGTARRRSSSCRGGRGRERRPTGHGRALPAGRARSGSPTPACAATGTRRSEVSRRVIRYGVDDAPSRGLAASPRPGRARAGRSRRRLGGAPATASRGGFDQLTQVTSSPSGDPAGTLYVVEQEGQVCELERRPRGRSSSTSAASSACCGERGSSRSPSTLELRPNALRLRQLHEQRRRHPRRALPANAAAHIGRTAHAEAASRVEHRRTRTTTAAGCRSARTDGCTWARRRRQRLRPRRARPELSSRNGKLLSIDPRNIGAGWRDRRLRAPQPLALLVRPPQRAALHRRRRPGQARRRSTAAGRGARRHTRELQWDACEGVSARQRLRQRAGSRGRGDQIRPISVYSHSLGAARSPAATSTAGSAPGVRGWYFYADYCSGHIWRLRINEPARSCAARGTSWNTSLRTSPRSGRA